MVFVRCHGLNVLWLQLETGRWDVVYDINCLNFLYNIYV